MKFRRKPTIVDAEQFNPPDQVPPGVSMEVGPGGKIAASVVTMHGEVALHPGDWVLPEPDGERFYPVDRETFEATYDPIDEKLHAALTADTPLAALFDKPEPYHSARDRVLSAFQRTYLRQVLDRSGQNLSQAARLAGVDRTTLHRLLDQLGMTRTSPVPEASNGS